MIEKKNKARLERKKVKNIILQLKLNSHCNSFKCILCIHTQKKKGGGTFNLFLENRKIFDS